jgi:CheY-like chemotaxis protein
VNPLGPILLVEDNPDDVYFMRRACKTAGIENPIHVAEDGQQAIDYLSGAGQYSDRAAHPLPCLVFLDLKLPAKTGLEVLAWIRKQAEFTTLVIVILTTSREPRDVHEGYRLGANAYVVKPSSPTQLAELVTSVKKFWINHNVVD